MSRHLRGGVKEGVAAPSKLSHPTGNFIAQVKLSEFIVRCQRRIRQRGARALQADPLLSTVVGYFDVCIREWFISTST
jgi:hypothetical protein